MCLFGWGWGFVVAVGFMLVLLWCVGLTCLLVWGCLGCWWFVLFLLLGLGLFDCLVCVCYECPVGLIGGFVIWCGVLGGFGVGLVCRFCLVVLVWVFVVLDGFWVWMVLMLILDWVCFGFGFWF